MTNQTSEMTSLKFSLGTIVATPGAMDALGKNCQSPGEFLSRHVCGDWGTVCKEDAELNNQALLESSRLLSSYSLKDETRLWIITEADRSSSCLLLPSEY
jgi:hypothetical protein